MSTAVFPSLAGLGFDFKRSPIWNNTIQTAVSGKETAIAMWSYPRWQWELTYEFLRSAAAYGEFQQLAGFFNARYGNFDTFLFTDPDDYTVTDQPLGVGDGVEDEFQLIRTLGGFVEPVLAPNVVTNIKVDGVALDPADYTVSPWGSATPGLVVFDTPPGDTLAITATFTFYFPVRFVDPTLDFSKFMNQLWAGDSVKMISQK